MFGATCSDFNSLKSYHKNLKDINTSGTMTLEVNNIVSILQKKKYFLYPEYSGLHGRDLSKLY